MSVDLTNIAELHRQVYERDDIVEFYAQTNDISPAELTVFSEFEANIVGKRVCDIGVGSGRTTPALAPRAGEYIGIDFAHSMVERCLKRFPQYNFVHGDARDLSRFADASFDFIVFSFNGIDYIDDADRKRVLREIKRLLAPNGVFYFCTHNLHFVGKGGSLADSIRSHLSFNPLSLMHSGIRLCGRVWGYMKAKRDTYIGENYAILPDAAHHYAFRTYHIGVVAQIAQLVEVGFSEPRVFNHEGKEISASVDNTTSHFIHFVVRNQAGDSKSTATVDDPVR